MRVFTIPLLALALLIAGCGGKDAPPVAKRTDAQVIKGWADTLRRGDVSGAARFFALPTRVANGTPEQELKTLSEVKAFNAALPCGAQLVRTRGHFGITIAEFRLTDRPGGDCGSGAGGTASTAFEIRDGKIVRWLRVPEGSVPQPEGDVV